MLGKPWIEVSMSANICCGFSFLGGKAKFKPRERISVSASVRMMLLLLMTFAFPYTGPNTNNLIKLCRNANIIVGQTPGQKIAKLRAPFKEKTELFQKSNVVYEIKCNNCEKSYVGETQRHLVERITEHKRSVKV